MFPLNPLRKGGVFQTILFLALAACQQQDTPVTALEEPAAKFNPAPELSGAASETAASEPQPAAAEPALPEPAPLNLEIPEDLLQEQARTGFPQTNDNRLPDLFARKKREGTSLSGELLFDEDEDIDVDTISGAKITINIPTGNKE